MFIKVIKHSLKDTSLKFKGVFKVSFKEVVFVKLRIFKGGRNSK